MWYLVICKNLIFLTREPLGKTEMATIESIFWKCFKKRENAQVEFSFFYSPILLNPQETLSSKSSRNVSLDYFILIYVFWIDFFVSDHPMYAKVEPHLLYVVV